MAIWGAYSPIVGATSTGPGQGGDPAPLPHLGLLLSPGTAKTLPAEYGSFALTGYAAGTKADRKTAAAQGTYSLTGQNATLSKTNRFNAAQGTYTLTGYGVPLVPARKLVAAYGTLTLTGQAATLFPAKTVTAGQGTYSLTGQAAGTRAARKMGTGLGPYVLTGYNAGLLWSGANRVMPAGHGSYPLTGQTATLLLVKKVFAGVGSYAVTGQAAGTRAARKIGAAQGAYTLTGFAATLSRTSSASSGAAAYLPHIGLLLEPSSNKGITADVGGYNLTGWDAVLRRSLVLNMPALMGAYVIEGSYAAVDLEINADYGTYTLIGQAATLAKGGVPVRTLTAERGTYVIDGRNLFRTITGTGSLTPASRTLAGSATTGHYATGSLLATLPVASGAGTTAHTGTGSLLVAAARVVAAGFNSRNDLDSWFPRLTDRAGGGTAPTWAPRKTRDASSAYDGAGDPTVTPAFVTALGQRGRTDTGTDVDIYASPAQVSGSGTVGLVLTGAGILSALAATVSSTGARGRAGTGALSVATTTLSGAGVRGRSGTGALQPQALVIQGQGEANGGPFPAEGTGALTAALGTISGSGRLGHPGTGTIAPSAATVLGIGFINLNSRALWGGGNLVGSSPSLTGAGIYHTRTDFVTEVELTSFLPVIEGEGTVQVNATGEGDLYAPAAEVSGTAFVPGDITGVGALVAANPALKVRAWVSRKGKKKGWSDATASSRNWTEVTTTPETWNDG